MKRIRAIRRTQATSEHSGVLEASRITVRFGALAALRDVDITIAAGEILGLIGPNGAGKTTLVNVLSGLQRPTEGRVCLEGRDITAWSPARRARSGVSRSFQGARLFNRLTVQENVEVPLVSVRRRSRAAASRLATELIESAGLHGERSMLAGQLPYGDARRLAVIRAAACEPRILMLDEPAAGLNEAETDALVTSIKTIRTTLGCGVVVIEHDMRFVMGISDRLQVLNFGQVLRIGSIADVQTDPAVVAAYLGDGAIADQWWRETADAI